MTCSLGGSGPIIAMGDPSSAAGGSFSPGPLSTTRRRCGTAPSSRLVVLIVDDIVGGEVIQRFFGPALRHEVGRQPADRSHVLRFVAEVADGDRIEEQRLRLPGGVFEVRLDAVARVARPLQKIVAL